MQELYRIMYKEFIEKIETYKKSRHESLGIEPNENSIKAFCKLNCIPYPLPNEEDYVKEMVRKLKERERETDTE